MPQGCHRSDIAAALYATPPARPAGALVEEVFHGSLRLGSELKASGPGNAPGSVASGTVHVSSRRLCADRAGRILLPSRRPRRPIDPGGADVNTYDPKTSIVYVHMARETDAYSTPLVRTPRCGRLPAGYANRSPRTRLSG